MGKITLSLCAVLLLCACNVKLLKTTDGNQWIGRRWQSYNLVNTTHSCSVFAPGIVTCNEPSGTMKFLVDENGIIQTWEFMPKQ